MAASRERASGTLRAAGVGSSGRYSSGPECWRDQCPGRGERRPRARALPRAASLAGLTSLRCTPGNAGTAALAENVSASLDDPEQLLRVAREHPTDLVVVGPEVPLAAGLADRLREFGIATFGPGVAAARIEASKAWAKDLMRGDRRADRPRGRGDQPRRGPAGRRAGRVCRP